MTIQLSPTVTPIAHGVDLLRADIDRIDDQILALLEQRYPLVQRLAGAKNVTGERRLALRPARERGIVERLAARAVGVPEADIRQIWRSIFALSARHQRPYRVILWGPEEARLTLTALAATRHGAAVPVEWADSAEEAWRAAAGGDAILMLPEGAAPADAHGLDLIERHATDRADHPWVLELGRLAEAEAEPGAWIAPTTGVVAYLGGHGSYSEEACLRVVPALRLLPLGGFADVLRAVREGSADVALVPVENSLVGPIEGVRDLLGHPELRVVGEEEVAVRLHLLGVEGASLETVRQVASHPAALGQCADWLGRRSWKEMPVASTAEAARAVAVGGDVTRAAIGSEAAAIWHGLTILARDLQGSDRNVTRFAIVERRREFA